MLTNVSFQSFFLAPFTWFLTISSMHSRMPYHVFLLWYLVLLTGCAPQFTPSHNAALAEPELKTTSFVSFDGTELPLRAWLPSGGIAAAKHIIIAVHGFNDYSNFINRGALYFNGYDIAVFSYDQRGFGKAPVRGRWSSSETMAQDLKTLVQFITQKHPDIPVYLLGHSMGGSVVIQAMAGEEHPDIVGAILVAPAVWARSTIPFYQNGALWLVAHTIPSYKVTGEVLKRKACSNIEALKELESDPLVIKETRFDTIYGLQNLMDAAYASADNFTLKTLFSSVSWLNLKGRNS
jgi:alpha-beta hydrolase superfamily lysophospholipase